MNYKYMGSSDGREVRQPAPVPATPLARQSSVYSLTFDEFQSTMGGIGKDFGSMNMDEFLKNIWTAEEGQVMASAMGGEAAGPSGGGGGGGQLQRQGSLTLPRTLSQKTVDEVWRGLVGGQPDFQQQRQPTLGEITLEEFLVRAGVVKEDIDQPAPNPNPNPIPIVNNSNTAAGHNSNGVFYSELPSPNSNPGLALAFGQHGWNNGTVVPSSATNLSMATRPYAAQLPLGNAADLASLQGMRGRGIVGMGDAALSNGLMSGVVGLGGGGVTVATVGSPANQISSDGLGKCNGDLSSLSPVPYAFRGGMRGRKCSGAVEKVVERRQKRMIKNRESAARSRARKQAYTMELETEVAKLKEQNQELQKKQVEIMEMQKNQRQQELNHTTTHAAGGEERRETREATSWGDDHTVCSPTSIRFSFRRRPATPTIPSHPPRPPSHPGKPRFIARFDSSCLF